MAEIMTSATSTDTHEMVVIHRAFRRESQLLGQFIAAVPVGDTERASVLARHLTWYRDGLTNHHQGEDQLLWPPLRQRAEVDTDIVMRMEGQHARVADTLADVFDTLPAWRASATVDRRDALVSALLAHRRVLIEHLDDEEDHLLPLAGRHLTGPEWAALGEHFVSTTPKAELLIFLGAVLEEATPDEQAALLGAMPLIARFAWRAVGRRRYTAYTRRIRGYSGRGSRPTSTKNHLTEV